MRRVLLAAALALAALVLTPGTSWACSCAMTSTAEQVRNAGTVASGTVDWRATDGERLTYRVDFDQVYKGSAATSERVGTQAQEAACGLTGLESGRRYLFFIDGVHPGTMRIGLCGGTTAYDEALAAEVEAITGPPAEPLAAAPVPVEGDDGGGRLPLVAGAGALLVVVAAAVALRRRAR